MEDLMTKQERIAHELSWCKAELTLIKEGLSSNYTEDYIKGAIDTLYLILKLENERAYT